MPRIQRSDVPEELLRHLLDRVQERHISLDDLHQVIYWIGTNPTVPFGPWYKRFQGVTICGHGSLVKTFLTPQQTATGTEVQ